MFARPQDSTKWEHHIRLLTILCLTTILFLLFYYNINKFTTGKTRPLLESGIEIHNGFHFPGIVICGPNINVKPKCRYGLLGMGKNEGELCDPKFWKRAPLTAFVNVYPDIVGEEWYASAKDCFLFFPPDSLLFSPRNIEQLTVEIFSNETTTAAEKLNRWAYFGIFWPWIVEDPRLARVDYINLPSQMSISFSRRQLFQQDGIIQLSYSAVTACRRVPGFRNATNKWGVIHLRPEYNSLEDGYVIPIFHEKSSFQFLDLVPILSSCLVLVYTIYKIFFGQTRLNPYGVMQKYIFKSVDTEQLLLLGISGSEGINLGRIKRSSNGGTTRRNGFHRMGDDEPASSRERGIGRNSFLASPPPPFEEIKTPTRRSMIIEPDVSERLVEAQLEIMSLKQEMNLWERFLRRYLIL